jgi:hypothetical protein
MPVIIILIMPTDWEIMFYDTRKNDHILPRGRIKVNVVSDRSTAVSELPAGYDMPSRSKANTRRFHDGTVAGGFRGYMNRA